MIIYNGSSDSTIKQISKSWHDVFVTQPFPQGKYAISLQTHLIWRWLIPLSFYMSLLYQIMMLKIIMIIIISLTILMVMIIALIMVMMILMLIFIPIIMIMILISIIFISRSWTWWWWWWWWILSMCHHVSSLVWLTWRPFVVFVCWGRPGTATAGCSNFRPRAT